MRTARLVRTTGLALALAGFLAACSSGSLNLNTAANDGSTLTTTPGQQLTEDMFLGKWDKDGERTNTANGDSSIGAIPSDIFIDIFGAGWLMERHNVLKTDTTGGYDVGSWRLEGTNTLVVKEKLDAPELRFEASFRDGYMYLKPQDGPWTVMERGKFFGF